MTELHLRHFMLAYTFYTALGQQGVGEVFASQRPAAKLSLTRAQIEQWRQEIKEKHHAEHVVFTNITELEG